MRIPVPAARIIARIVLIVALLAPCIEFQVSEVRHSQCGPLNPCSPFGQPTSVTSQGESSWFGVQRTNAEIMAGKSHEITDADPPKAVDVPLERLGPRVKSLLATPPVGRAAMSVDLTFVGATGTGVPDTMGAVGPTQYLVVLNSVVRSFNKTTGAQDGVLDVGLSAFLGAGAYDPKARYDRLSGRWFVGAIGYPGTRVLLAVSSGGVLTAQGGWTVFSFQQDQVAPAGNTGCAVDYTRMSVDAYAVYFVFDMYTSNYASQCPANPTAMTAFVIRKTSVLGTGPLVGTAFRGTGYFRQPVDQFESDTTAGYIMSSSFTGSVNLNGGAFYRVIDPGGSPSLSAEIPFTGRPLNNKWLSPRHKGNALESGIPGDSSGRMVLPNTESHSVPIRHGRLWYADVVGVDNTGSVLNTMTATRDGLRFVELGNLDAASSNTLQTSLLFAPSASNDFDQRNYWMPALMVSGQGHVVVAGSSAGTNDYINAALAGRLRTDSPGTLRPVNVYTNATAAYNGPPDPNFGNRRRWGDYSNVSLDPCDDMTMWAIQQFTATADTWGVAVARIKAPPPAPISAVVPATLPFRSASVNVTVTGTPVDGEGFYDPGTGFACRLGVAISGGVAVNSVTYNGPTSVTLNVSTVSASNAPHTLTITNPDGQIASVTVMQASSFVFSDDPLMAASSVIRAVQITELRTIIDAARARYGLLAYSYTDLTLAAGTTVIRWQHIADLRIALAAAYVAAARTPPIYTDPALGPGTVTKAVHITELRAAINALP